MSLQFLIADHDPLLREECRRCLAARGHDVETAADALQCIEQLRATSPSVLVLDPEILWGGGDGVLEWLQDEEPIVRVTVVLTNGHSSGRIPDRLAHLITQRLERPCGIKELVQFVNRLEDVACRSLSAEHGLHGAVSLPHALPPLPLDLQIERRAQEELQSSPYMALHRLCCRLHNHRLVVRGTVPTYFLKQMAQNVLQRRLPGGPPVENLLEVVAPSSETQARPCDS
jgi:DNA-binding response OmpR family regulator